MSKILAFIEQNKENLKRVSFEVLTAAKQLSTKTGNEVVAVVINGNENLKNLVSEYGINQLVNLNSADLTNYSVSGAAQVVADFAKENNCNTLIFGSNSVGLELAPRVTIRLEAGYVSDCVGLDYNNEIIASKPVYAGKAVVKVKVNKATKVFSLRPNIFTATKTETVNTTFENKSVTIDSNNLKVKVTNTIKNEGKIDVAEADKIVTGGRGFKGPENFFLVENLAKALGGAVGASRAVVDAGWRPHGEQVGQTGKTVSPNLYVACAVSGAVQHLAGMSTSKIILAINKDKDAPIFKVCDYGIVGDVFDVLPKMTQLIENMPK